MKHLTAISCLSLVVSLLLSSGSARALYTLAPGFYDDTLPSLSYTGTWAAYTAAGLYNGAMSFTQTYGDVLAFDFVGDGVVIYYHADVNAGDAQICIDGSCTVVSMFSSVTVVSNYVEISGLGDGVHSVEMTKAVDNGDYIGLDAIHVLPYLAPVPTLDPATIQLEVTAEVAPPAYVSTWDITDSDGVGHTVGFSTSATAGDVVIVGFLSALLVVSLFSVGLQMYRG
jgi:hypothetical protein